ncbi:MAG: bifunctional diaminohydroxyphosphoribosylaminopyrimidine deaminase/5-amino-6-(5-phosphoribosylamino)uracil reductase RibD [Clostridium fessum]
MVGAVLVKDGHIIGEGYHTRYGQLHAEREAFKNAAERGEETAGADLYVTLEPCCHTGKQPPCTEAVLASGAKRVIVGCTDPNPVGGRARHPASEGKRAGSVAEFYAGSVNGGMRCSSILCGRNFRLRC